IPVRVSITRATDRRVLWANRRWLDYYGLADATIGSFSIRDAYVDPAEHDRLVAELRAQGSVSDFLAQIRDKAGAPHWLTLSARRVRYDDQDAIIVASVDITNLRRAEKAEQRALREMTGVVNAVADGLIGIDAKGVIRLFNPAAEKIFGYTAAEATGRNVSILMPSPFAQEHDGYMANYLRTGVAKVIGKGREVIGRRKDGSTFPMSLAINDVRADGPSGADAEGESLRVRFIGAIRDITERKQAETALLTAKSQAEIANRAKSDFLAHVTHELRTPLNAILGFADMIRARALGADALDRYAEYGDHIHGSGRSLLKIIDGLLDMTTTEAGRYVLAEETLTLAQIVAPVLDSLRPAAEGVGVRLAAEFPPTLPALRVDVHAVRQVFGNVLSNALKFTPRNGAIVVSAAIEESGAVAVTVADAGTPGPHLRAVRPHRRLRRPAERGHGNRPRRFPQFHGIARRHPGYPKRRGPGNHRRRPLSRLADCRAVDRFSRSFLFFLPSRPAAGRFVNDLATGNRSNIGPKEGPDRHGPDFRSQRKEAPAAGRADQLGAQSERQLLQIRDASRRSRRHCRRRRIRDLAFGREAALGHGRRKRRLGQNHRRLDRRHGASSIQRQRRAVHILGADQARVPRRHRQIPARNHEAADRARPTHRRQGRADPGSRPGRRGPSKPITGREDRRRIFAFRRIRAVFNSWRLRA
ncbi:MAG: PAS domain S-box protein, partial [Pseudomonadota bacterium]